MLSVKNSYWSILLIGLFAYSCTPAKTDSNEFSDYQPSEERILNAPFIGQLEDAPVHFSDLWNRQTIDKLGITRITVYSFGGKSPEDTLEKKVFNFSNHALKLDYLDYKFDETPAVWSKGTANWTNDKNILNLSFSKHFGIDRKLTTKVQRNEDGFTILRKKSLDRYDTTWVKGTFENPSLVMTKIGKSVFSVDVYLPEGSSTSDIEYAFKKLNLSQNDLLLTQKNVVFMNNGRPTSAFLLNEAFSQVSQTKSWKYDEYQNLIAYEEMIGSSTVRSITWKYRKDLLPESVTIDRNTYFYHYEK